MEKFYVRVTFIGEENAHGVLVEEKSINRAVCKAIETIPEDKIYTGFQLTIVPALGYSKTIHIAELPQGVQNSIKLDLELALINATSEFAEYDKLLNESMNGRLCDIEDTIDISPYVLG